MLKHSGAVSKAPRKIASNQRWVGYYSSDELADYGMGVPSYPGENKVAIYLTESILKPYIGMKIVGIPSDSALTSVSRPCSFRR